jgi:hypothetical protein
MLDMKKKAEVSGETNHWNNYQMTPQNGVKSECSSSNHPV